MYFYLVFFSIILFLGTELNICYSGYHLMRVFPQCSHLVWFVIVVVLLSNERGIFLLLSLLLLLLILLIPLQRQTVYLFIMTPPAGWYLSSLTDVKAHCSRITVIGRVLDLLTVSAVFWVWNPLNAPKTVLTDALYIRLVRAVLNHLQIKICDKIK